MHSQTNESKENELVSIIIPVLNGEKFIDQCLKSIFNQTYKVIEVIIVDGGSKDKTLEIASKFSAKIIHQKSQGVSAARNEGINAAKGKFIAWCDVDDFYSQNKIELQKRFLDNHPEIGVVWTDVIIIEKNRKSRASVNKISWNFFQTYKKNPLVFSSTMFRKNILTRNKFNPKLQIAEDFDLYIRLSKITKFASIQRPLTFIRKHESSLTRKRLLSNKSSAIVLYINGIINRWEFIYRLFFQFFIYLGLIFFKRRSQKLEFLDKYIQKFI